jgi:hypothetical protein
VADGAKEARDNLHALWQQVVETAARAHVAGSPTLTVEVGTFVGMAQVMFRGVVALESFVGSTPTPAPAPGVSASPSNDPNAYIAQLRAQVEKQTQDMQRKIYEDLRKQFEQQAKPGDSPPPVQG